MLPAQTLGGFWHCLLCVLDEVGWELPEEPGLGDALAKQHQGCVWGSALPCFISHGVMGLSVTPAATLEGWGHTRGLCCCPQQAGNLPKLSKGKVLHQGTRTCWGFWHQVEHEPGKCPGGKGETEAGEMPSGHQDMCFHWEGGQTLAQISQGGCGISILGDTKKTEKNLEKLNRIMSNHLSRGVWTR